MTTPKAGLTRRKFLQLLGQSVGATTVLVAGGVVYRAATTGVFSTGRGPAYQPWTDWNIPQNTPLDLVRAAILASNPHNSQPWLFRVTDDAIDVYVDLTRNLGTIDPYLREMYTGLGCAIANLTLAAAAEGYAHTLTLMPTPQDDSHVARVAISHSTPTATPRYTAIPQRRTNRGPYAEQSVSTELLTQLAAITADFENVGVRWLTTPEEKRRFSEASLAATEALTADEDQSIDSAHWQRATWPAVQQQADGITYDAQGMPPNIAAITKMLPPLDRETNDRFWLQTLRDTQLPTAAAFGIITVRDSSNLTQRLQGGMVWQHMHLQMTLDGLVAQPLNQLPERKDRERQLGLELVATQALADLVGDPAWVALMPFRLGWPTRTANPAPRRPVEAVLLT